MNLRGLTLVILTVLVGQMRSEDFEDLQTEFYLPYSETEDVDFSIVRPGGYGCYQWSTNNTEAIRLDPIHVDYDKMCGHKLEFQILPGAVKGEKTTIQIVAENVELDGYDEDVPPVVEYIVHVHPVHHMEVLGLKTDLQAGSEPVPFGIAGYDDEDNEFDTLDGLQINWYIGSNREIAAFEKHRQIGPIVKLVPMGAGKGAVMAVLTDPNYENVDPAILEFSVAAPLMIEPDGPFLLEGAKVQMKLLEKAIDKDGKPVVKELLMGEQTEGENESAKKADYYFEVKEPEYVKLDPKTNEVVAIQEGETTLFAKNLEGEILKAVPIRVTTAHSLSVTTVQDPESKQLILGQEYDVVVDIYNKDGRKIYPSENILCKTTFPKQFDIADVAENGLAAKVKAVNTGLGKIKASLRSVLTDDDEELEIVPHVKGSTDFEVYETVVIKPRETILPWDENVKNTYELKYQASGGGKVYSFTTDNEELGTADNEGKVTTHSGPGTFTVKAAMVNAPQNFDEAKVYLLPVTHMNFKPGMTVETATHTPITLAIQMKTFLEENDDPIMFTDCAEVPYQVTLSDNKNFEVVERYPLGGNRIYESCASFTVKAHKPGTTCKVSISYTEPSTGRTLKDHVHISSYNSLETVYPKPQNDPKFAQKSMLFLPIGSKNKVVFKGGPTPWMSKPSAHFTQVEVDDPEIIRVTRIKQDTFKPPVLTGSYSDVYAVEVVCIREGQTSFTFMIGNTPSSTNEHPIQSAKEVYIHCDLPTKIVVKAEPRKMELDTIQYVANPKTSRIMVHNHHDILLKINVKNKEGITFNDISSLKFDFKISDESILKKTFDHITIPEVPLGPEYGSITVSGKGYQSLSPVVAPKTEVDVWVALVGYDEKVLKENKATTPPAIPKVHFDDDEDDDDDEAYMNHNHNLSSELEFELASDANIAMVIRQLRQS